MPKTLELISGQIHMVSEKKLLQTNCGMYVSPRDTLKERLEREVTCEQCKIESSK